jgi:hypothetical protein
MSAVNYSRLLPFQPLAPTPRSTGTRRWASCRGTGRGEGPDGDPSHAWPQKSEACNDYYFGRDRVVCVQGAGYTTFTTLIWVQQP